MTNNSQRSPLSEASNFKRRHAFLFKLRFQLLTVVAGITCALAMPTSTRAQQWTNGAGNTINNTNSGNVGVGTTAPAVKLHVLGGIYSSQVIESANTAGFRLVVTGPGDSRASWWYDGGTTTTRLTSVANVKTSLGSNGIGDRLFLDLAGNVGIDTTTPSSKLHIVAGQFAPAISGTGTNSSFRIGAGAATNLVLDAGINTTGGIYTWLQSRNLSNYALNYDLALNPNGGNVGVGTVTPTAKLHVVGNGTITGNLTVNGTVNAKYQDMAEWVPSSQTLAAGTVVVLDSSKSNQVIASAKPYDSHVAGVISERPGLALGEQGEGQVLVATTGRVKVKVDATDGPIQIGDLLVTSGKEGFAMKSVPVDVGGVQIHRPGTLIGKALEPLAGGQGYILVLLSMQ